jgi:hypothetical protein
MSTNRGRKMKVKTIFIKSSPVKSSSRVEVATYERGKLALQFRGENGVYSKLPRCPAKSLRDAMKQVKHIYGEVYLTTS